MGVVAEGDLIALWSNVCQPKLIQGVGSQVIHIVDLILSNSILQRYRCHEGLLHITKRGFGSEKGWR